MEGNGNAGLNRFANTLKERVAKQTETSLVIDFGQINADFSLTTNTFPVPIPRTDYSVCRSALGIDVTGNTTPNTDTPPEFHMHNLSITTTSEKLKAGDRVLVAWVQNEAVVIDVILSAMKL